MFVIEPVPHSVNDTVMMEQDQSQTPGSSRWFRRVADAKRMGVPQSHVVAWHRVHNARVHVRAVRVFAAAV